MHDYEHCSWRIKHHRPRILQLMLNAIRLMAFHQPFSVIALTKYDEDSNSARQRMTARFSTRTVWIKEDARYRLRSMISKLVQHGKLTSPARCADAAPTTFRLRIAAQDWGVFMSAWCCCAVAVRVMRILLLLLLLLLACKYSRLMLTKNIVDVECSLSVQRH